MRSTNSKRNFAHDGDAQAKPVFRCGTAALVGRPNVGKSTLLNALIGWRLSIVSPKAQTTRHRILGDSHRRDQPDSVSRHPRPAQTARARDQPPAQQGRPANHCRSRCRHAGDRSRTLEQRRPGRLRSEWPRRSGRACSSLNKIDAKKDKKILLPFLADINSTHDSKTSFWFPRTRKTASANFSTRSAQRLPESPPAFAEDEITDRSERFLASELIREQLMRQLAQELPYSTTVEIENFLEGDERAEIDAMIWVERESQKAIVIGEGGAMLKSIGTVRAQGDGAPVRASRALAPVGESPRELVRRRKRSCAVRLFRLSMRVEQQPAFVLHARPWRETSLIDRSVDARPWPRGSGRARRAHRRARGFRARRCSR